jgi:hypothetical protein
MQADSSKIYQNCETGVGNLCEVRKGGRIEQALLFLLASGAIMQPKERKNVLQ